MSSLIKRFRRKDRAHRPRVHSPRYGGLPDRMVWPPRGEIHDSEVEREIMRKIEAERERKLLEEGSA